MDIAAYLKSKDISFHMSDENYQMDCPFCDDERSRMGVSQTRGSWQCFNCFPEYALVTLGDNSVKEIKDVVVGDTVINSSGTISPVLKTHNNGKRDKLLKIKAMYGNTIECTPEHEILVISKKSVIYGRSAYHTNHGKQEFGSAEFKSAKDIEVGDWILSPKIKKQFGETISLDIKKFKKRFGSYNDIITENIPADNDLGYIMGLYCAEGSYNRGIFYSLNISEDKIANKIKRIFNEKFNLSVKIYLDNKHSVQRVFVGHTHLAKWFNEYLGHLAENKKMPDFVFSLNRKFRKGFLVGLYAGDGSKGSKSRTDITTISKHLGLQGKWLAQSLGLVSGVDRIPSHIGGDGIVRKTAYRNSIGKSNTTKKIGSVVLPNYYAYRVYKIIEETYEGNVYDLTVGGNHTYTVNGIVVHNCNERGKKFFSFQKMMKDENIQDIKMNKGSKEKKKVEINQGLAHKHADLLKKKGRDVLDYLRTNRGFSDKAIEHFQLGSKKFKGYEYVSIPYWKFGQLVNMKFRALNVTERKYKWRRITGGESSLFHDEIINDMNYNNIYITEAELDAVSLFSNGIENVVSVTTGAKGFKDEWYDRLERFERIYLIFDNDEKGQQGAFKMARRLGLDRCYNIMLPKKCGKDLNQFFWDEKLKKQKNKISEFKKLSKECKKFEARDVIKAKDALKNLYRTLLLEDEDELYGFETPWENVNKITKEIRPGYLVALGSPPKIGKTTFALDWIDYQATTYKTKVLIYECEMKPERLSEKLVRKYNPEFSADAEKIKPYHVLKAFDKCPDELYFAHPELNSDQYKAIDEEQKYELNIDTILERIAESIQRYGIQFVVFDHLHFLIRGENENSEIGLVTRKMKMFAEKWGIVFLLLVQPKKIGFRMMTTNDFKGSSSIFQDCDLSMIIHRGVDADPDADKDTDENEGYYGDATYVSVSGRFTEGGKTTLTFDGKRSRYYGRGSIYDETMEKLKIKNKLKKEKRHVKG